MPNTNTPRTDALTLEVIQRIRAQFIVLSKSAEETIKEAVEATTGQLETELGEAREQLKYALERDWTASLCDRVNELLREHPIHSEAELGETCSSAIQAIHGYCGTLKGIQTELQSKLTALEAVVVAAKEYAGTMSSCCMTGEATGEVCKLHQALSAYDNYKKGNQ